MNNGTVYWLTGLSGAGKTTIGKAFYEKIKKISPNIVFLDGDSLREVFGQDLGYTWEERKKCAQRYSRLCKLLSEQGLIVICCTISMFDEIRVWNRDNISHYIEIYIKVSKETLIQRNQKDLYKKSMDKQEKVDLVGITINMEEPKNPDIVIENDGSYTVEQCVSKIFEK